MAQSTTNIPKPADPPPGGDLENLGSIIFPSDLESYKFYISFDFRKFTRRAVTDRSFYGPGSGGNKIITRLPIPGNMVDTTQVNWGEHEMKPLLGTIIDVGADLRQRMTENASSLGMVQEALADLGRIAGGAAVSTLGELNLLKAGLASQGIAINPFMTVMFQSPTFKQHQFQWSFYPHTKEETDTLRAILARFRYHMLPSIRENTAGFLLNYPDMCYVTLHPDNSYTYKFKPCVITSASMNYAPNGPSFFEETKAPSEIILTLNLLEMEFWVQEDVKATWNKNLEANGSIVVTLK